VRRVAAGRTARDNAAAAAGGTEDGDVVRRIAVIALALLALAGGCKRKNETAANLNAQNKVAVRPVRLFYESPQLLLAAETRNIPLPESPAGAIPVVVRELLKGPATPTLGRLFPPDTAVRGAYLLSEGTVIVDLGGATLQQGWGTGSHHELMAVYSVVSTIMSNFADARRVRFLVHGAPSETLAGHVSLNKSLVTRPDLLAR
jgi:hypothetical protein